MRIKMKNGEYAVKVCDRLKIDRSNFYYHLYRYGMTPEETIDFMLEMKRRDGYTYITKDGTPAIKKCEELGISQHQFYHTMYRISRGPDETIEHILNNRGKKSHPKWFHNGVAIKDLLTEKQYSRVMRQSRKLGITPYELFLKEFADACGTKSLSTEDVG